MTQSTFETLGLPAPLLRALLETGYTTPTPIQQQAIPPLLAGRDILGLAETGSGKTAAFTLPILARLSDDGQPAKPKNIRALILAPTRELAIQIGDSISTYGKNLSLTHAVIYGGVGISPQIRTLAGGVDVLVATPGRLIDLAGSRALRFDDVRHFVLDEADRMLDMGFIRDVRRIVRALPKSRQSLLFSATMPDDIAELAAEMLNDPVRIEVARTGTPVDRIMQRVHFVEEHKKRAAIVALLKNPALARVIAFTRTKRGADRLARVLQAASIEAYAIHGNKSQSARQNALASFRDGQARVLVATDIAARGIDIDAITHVINYDIPNVPETYVHRIGRTARAGASGAAISLCGPEERSYLRDIERLMGLSVADAGGIEDIATVEASLPPVRRAKTVASGDDTETHFVRERGKVEGRRFVPRLLERDAWHEGKDLRAHAEQAKDVQEQRRRVPDRDDHRRSDDRRKSFETSGERRDQRPGPRPGPRDRDRPSYSSQDKRERDGSRFRSEYRPGGNDRSADSRDRTDPGDRTRSQQRDRSPRREGTPPSRSERGQGRPPRQNGERPWHNRDRAQESASRPDHRSGSDRPWRKEGDARSTERWSPGQGDQRRPRPHEGNRSSQRDGQARPDNGERRFQRDERGPRPQRSEQHGDRASSGRPHRDRDERPWRERSDRPTAGQRESNDGAPRRTSPHRYGDRDGSSRDRNNNARHGAEQRSPDRQTDGSVRRSEKPVGVRPFRTKPNQSGDRRRERPTRNAGS